MSRSPQGVLGGVHCFDGVFAGEALLVTAFGGVFAGAWPKIGQDETNTNNANRRIIYLSPLYLVELVCFLNAP